MGEPLNVFSSNGQRILVIQQSGYDVETERDGPIVGSSPAPFDVVRHWGVLLGA